MEEPKGNFINFWEFLGLPMDASLSAITLAYAGKFTEIEDALEDTNTSLYSIQDLNVVNQAYETLSDPVKRNLHNCIITGQDPVEMFDFMKEEIMIDDNIQATIDAFDALFLVWLTETTRRYVAMTRKHAKESSGTVYQCFHNIAEGLIRNLSQFSEQPEILKAKMTIK